jgi:5'-3' exonuclease
LKVKKALDVYSFLYKNFYTKGVGYLNNTPLPVFLLKNVLLCVSKQPIPEISLMVDFIGSYCREKVSPHYKLNRKPKDFFFLIQVSINLLFLLTLNLKVLSIFRVEADDIISLFVDKGKVTFISVDKDLQLLSYKKNKQSLLKKKTSYLYFEFESNTPVLRLTKTTLFKGDCSDNVLSVPSLSVVQNQLTLLKKKKSLYINKGSSILKKFYKNFLLNKKLIMFKRYLVLFYI